MSLWSRLANVLRTPRLTREIDEELASHIAEAIARGRDPEEARRAFGSTLRPREQSRDIRVIPWLDSLRADAIFGFRQLRKKKVTSAAAILSLALAIGACTSAFRLIDALLLRPLPVTHAEQLYALSRHGIGPEGKPQSFDGWAYPAFQRMRDAVKDRADFTAISYAQVMDVTYGSGQEIEKAHLQYVSGCIFDSFGVRPALGRVLTERDDLKPAAHPYAVLSYDYWTRRFGQDRTVVGRTFQMGGILYEIVGVAAERFTGTETGTMTDVFVPTMMHPSVKRSDATWLRTIVRLKRGAVEPVRQILNATSRAFEEDRLKGSGLSKERIERFLDQTVAMEPAAAGVSGLQREYRVSLAALGALVALVLLIACANVANLMTAQAAARSREMALRVSIGAGRGRLVQLMLVESAWLALLAAAIGAVFAWWSAPFIVARINPPDNPARLLLPADARVICFGLAMTLVVVLLLGLAPAFRASAVKPVNALKGGHQQRSRNRLMLALIAAQVAFCFLVIFIAGLFVATFQALSNVVYGFSADRVLTLDTVTQRPQPAAAWDQMVEHLRTVPGVETAALADWALMNGNSRNNFIVIDGAPPTDILTYFRYVGPGWIAAMKIPFIDGRDFRPSDTSPGAAIVNETFAKEYFHGANPVGKTFDRGNRMLYRIVGLVRDARYREVREPMLPVAYVPVHAIDAKGQLQPLREGTFIVRTSGADPLRLASALRQEVAREDAGFRVTNLHTQRELNQQHTVRERLLASLALFFAAVALLLAGIGLYGVLDYSVLQRRREIGIRMAIGARPGHIARRVTTEVFAMVVVGALAGLGLGMMSARFIETLLYQVKDTDVGVLVLPAITIVAAALLAALPPVIRAVRTDPGRTLRIEA